MAANAGTNEREVDALTHAVMELLEERASRGGRSGVPMGELVDALVRRGHQDRDVELAIWRVMQTRRATPNGFVCRVLRQRAPGRDIHTRTYEFTLIPWSAEHDAQLDLPEIGSTDPAAIAGE